MTTLKTLTWSNMFSYGEDNSIELNEHPIVQLVGLNGHGKSSIPLILEELLFNKNSKGTKRGAVLNRYGSSKIYRGTLTFSEGGSEYALAVYTTATKKQITLLKDGVDISGHTSTVTLKELERILGEDHKTFASKIYQNGKSGLSFLTDTDTNRKKFLIDLLGLAKYVTIFDKIKEVHKQAGDSISKLSSACEVMETWLANNSSDLAPMALKDEPELDTSKEAVHLEFLKTTLASIADTNSKITKNNKLKAMLEAIEIPETPTISEKINFEYLTQDQGKYNTQAAQADSIIKKMSGLKGTCHTCGQPIDSHKIQEIVTEETRKKQSALEKAKQTSEEIAKAKAANSVYDAYVTKLAEFEKLLSAVSKDMETTPYDSLTIQEEIAAIEARWKKAKAEIKEIKDYNAKVIAHNSRAETIKAQITKVTEDLETKLTLLIQEQDIFDELELLKKIFSTNGLVAYKIESCVKALENITNEYLEDLSDGRFIIRFVLQNDKLNVSIVDNGREVEIVDLSSGELARVNTATLLAIRKVMASLSNKNINVLFLDETIDTLDTDGKEKLIEVLLREENLNTFIVSHGYTHPLLTKINVVKEDNISRLE